LAKSNRERYITIDASSSEEEVAKKIKETLTHRFLAQ